MSSLAPLLDAVTAWASAQGDIVGLALVGSHARNTAGPESDVDLVVLTPKPVAFRESLHWLGEIDWPRVGASVVSSHDAQYGVAWSRHVRLSNGVPVEFTFAYPSWAATSPCDPGTLSVVSAGCRVLFDPQRLFQDVLRYAA